MSLTPRPTPHERSNLQPTPLHPPVHAHPTGLPNTYLPSIAVDAEQLLAALLVRLPLADPDGIWTLSKNHLGQAADSPDTNSHFLMGDGPSWHYRWNGSIQAFDIAAALTDTVTGLADATTVLRPGQSLTVSYGAAKLNLHGEV